jgi:hypothetical protein
MATYWQAVETVAVAGCTWGHIGQAGYGTEGGPRGGLR